MARPDASGSLSAALGAGSGSVGWRMAAGQVWVGGTQVASGIAFREAVVQSAAVRAKPIALTALAAMLGALFILDDPIFNGLAISLIFGILVSTVLTLLVIPLLYYIAFRSSHEGDHAPSQGETA